MPTKPNTGYVLHLEPVTSPRHPEEEIVRLRGALKVALRRYGLRCTRVSRGRQLQRSGRLRASGE